MLVAETIRRLGSRIDPVVLCLVDVGQLGERMRREWVPVIALWRRPGLDFSLARRLSREIEAFQLDVVHADLVAVADELDRLEGAVADVNTPGEAGCHVRCLLVGRVSVPVDVTSMSGWFNIRMRAGQPGRVRGARGRRSGNRGGRARCVSRASLLIRRARRLVEPQLV